MVVVSAPRAVGQSVPAEAAVASVGDYVERYYARAQSIVVDENVAIQPLAHGPERRRIRPPADLRTAESNGIPMPPATRVPRRSTRQLIAINGRPPRAGAGAGMSRSAEHLAGTARVSASGSPRQVHLQGRGTGSRRGPCGRDDRLSIGHAGRAEGGMEGRMRQHRPSRACPRPHLGRSGDVRDPPPRRRDHRPGGYRRCLASSSGPADRPT